MPSTSLQSRITAFESLAGSPPSASVKGSKSSNLLQISTSSPSLSIPPFPPPKVPSRSPSPSPPNLGRKTSLIDLKDWVVDDGPPKYNGFVALRTNGKPDGINDVTRTPTRRAVGFDNAKAFTNGHNFISTPLISLESPPKLNGPPLPPRKVHRNSPESTGASTTRYIPNSSSTSLPPPKRSDSLTVEHTYPPLSNLDTSCASRKSHAPGSSISSFHSVSLSSDTDPSTPGSVSNFISTFPMDQDGSEADTVSLDESYENVSVTSIASPTTAATLALNWEKAMGPPKLPQRSFSPSLAAARAPPTSFPPRPSSSTTRRVPPPPPSRSASSRASLISNTASDRSSLLSTTSGTSLLSQTTNNQSLSRPTPVPAAARKRYEAVFVANVLRNRKQPAKANLLSVKKSRQAAGWRGLSVDLIPIPGGHPVESANSKRIDGEKTEKDGWEMVSADERLDGSIVKLVWSASKLDKGKLRTIWNECDTTSLGSLDRDSFVRGMWRIDEELRRAHTRTSSAFSSTPFRPRQPPKLTNPKIILH